MFGHRFEVCAKGRIQVVIINHIYYITQNRCLFKDYEYGFDLSSKQEFGYRNTVTYINVTYIRSNQRASVTLSLRLRLACMATTRSCHWLWFCCRLLFISFSSP